METNLCCQSGCSTRVLYFLKEFLVSCDIFDVCACVFLNSTRALCELAGVYARAQQIIHSALRMKTVCLRFSLSYI
jgi:hypothetical protein